MANTLTSKCNNIGKGIMYTIMPLNGAAPPVLLGQSHLQHLLPPPFQIPRPQIRRSNQNPNRLGLLERFSIPMAGGSARPIFQRCCPHLSRRTFLHLSHSLERHLRPPPRPRQIPKRPALMGSRRRYLDRSRCRSQSYASSPQPRILRQSTQGAGIPHSNPRARPNYGAQRNHPKIPSFEWESQFNRLVQLDHIRRHQRSLLW